MWARVRGRLAALLWRNRGEREMDEEWRFHLESRIDTLVESGVDRIAAEEQARREFGPAIKWKEDSRDARGTAWLDDFRRDVSYAWRQLRRTPGFTVTALITTALGVGATTAVFTVVNAVLVRPLPFANAGRLVQIVDRFPADDQGPARSVPTALELHEFEDLRARVRTLKRVGLYTGANLTMTRRGEADRLVATRMSADFLAMLGDQPILGRGFDASDEASGHSAVVVLSFGAWQRLFGGAPNVLGQALTLDGQPFTVIGVMPATFAFPDRLTDVWVPFVFEPQPGASRRFFVYGEIAEGVPLDAAAAEVSGLLQERRGFSPVEDFLAAGEPLPFGLAGWKDELVTPVRPALRLLGAAAVAVLLLACVNIATLLLARGTSRRREIGIRVALGAGRSRLFRQLLTESLLVSAAGGFVGLWLAAAGLALLRTWGAGLVRRDLGVAVSIPRLAEVQLDGTVVLVAATLAVASGLLAGVWPALRHAVTDRLDMLRGHTATDTPGTGITRRVSALDPLIVTQVAVAITLMVGGVLLMRSFVNLARVDLGFNPANVLTFQVSFPSGRYARETLEDFSHDVVASLRDVPGVQASAYTHFLPMVRFRSGGRMTTTPQPPAGPRPPGAPTSPEYPAGIWLHHDLLRTLEMTVVDGRSFDERDRAGSPKVVIINETLASSGLLGPRPVGQSVYFGTDGPWEVIGVVKDFAQFGLDAAPEPIVLSDARQRPALPGAGGITPYVVIRTNRSTADILPAIRTAVSRVDRDAAVVNVATMDDVIGHAISRPRLYAAMMAIFAISAVLIAASGLGGIVSYAVTQRTRETGIRLALGATKRRVLWLFIARSVRLATTGVAIGLGVAAALSRYLEGLLFGVTPMEPASFALAVALVVAVAIPAAMLPATRACRADSLTTLRSE